MNNRCFVINSVPLEEVAHPVLGEVYCNLAGDVIKVAGISDNTVSSYYILQMSQLWEEYNLTDLDNTKALKLFWTLTKNNSRRTLGYESNKNTDD